MDGVMWEQALWEVWPCAAGRCGRLGHGGCGREQLNTTQIYARIYDETIYRQFKEAMSHLEAIEVDPCLAPGKESTT